MSEIFICTGCYETQAEDTGADYCDVCDSDRYFAWVETGDYDEDF